MATDLLTSVARSAGEAPMPHRLLALIPYPKTYFLGIFAGAGSLVASITNEQLMSAAAGVVAVGAILAQPAMRAYDGWMDRRRASRAKDREAELLADTKEYETRTALEKNTATELGIALGRLKVAEEQIERLVRQNEQQQAQLDQAKRLGKYAAKTAVKLEEKVNDNASRLATVEAVQGSLSGDAIPAPVPPEPSP